MPAVRVHQLAKRFGDTQAVAGVSFAVEEGEEEIVADPGQDKHLGAGRRAPASSRPSPGA